MDKKAKILDIAMNLNRIGNWAADGFSEREKRIVLFLNQTANYVRSIDATILPRPFKETFDHFLKEFRKLEKEGRHGPRDELFWAERMMTWGNILTHRAKLL